MGTKVPNEENVTEQVAVASSVRNAYAFPLTFRKFFHNVAFPTKVFQYLRQSELRSKQARACAEEERRR